MQIGFIGLGQMGSAMARNLLKAGHDVTIWNRSPEKAKDLIASGAKWADKPNGAARGEVVLSMLADDAAVTSIVYGEGGILECPALHVSHSTISISLAERLTEDQGLRSGFVSAPVFGRPAAAEGAKLFIVAAGKDAEISRCEALFAAIGQRVFRLGPTPSSANRMKLAGNFMIMAAIEAMSEAMAFGQAGGVDRAAMLEVLTGTIFGAPVYKVYGELLVESRFRPAGFAAPLGLKDMNLVDAAATESRIAMPVLGVVRDHLRTTIAREGDDVDWAAIALTIWGTSDRA